MKEFIVHCPNGIRLQWFGTDMLSVRREAEEAGHRVVSVQLVCRTPPSNLKELAVHILSGPMPAITDPAIVAWCCCGEDRPCPTHTPSLHRS